MARLSGIVVKFMCSASVAWGSLVWTLGVDLALLIKPCCGGRPTYKIEEDGHTDVGSGPVCLSKMRRIGNRY